MTIEFVNMKFEKSVIERFDRFVIVKFDMFLKSQINLLIN